jgi:hypothetical protein
MQPHTPRAQDRSIEKSRAGCSTSRPWWRVLISFISKTALDKIWIGSGVEYIKDMMFA